MLHLQKPRLGSRKRETHDRPNYPVRRSPTTAAHTLPQRGSNPGQVTYRIAPTNTNEPNSAETETYFPLYFLPSSEKYFFLDHEAGNLLYHRNLVKSHPKQLFWLRTLVKKSFLPALPRRSAAWRTRKNGYQNAETVAVDEANIFLAHLDGAGSSVFRRAPPAQRRSCCTALGSTFFPPSLRRKLSFSSPHAKHVALESPA